MESEFRALELRAIQAKKRASECQGNEAIKSQIEDLATLIDDLIRHLRWIEWARSGYQDDR